MRFLIVSYILLNFASAFAGECIIFDDSISKEILSMDCNIKNIANAIHNEKAIIPSKIYHYGKESILARNTAARTIPQEDWDKFIMGDSTTWGLGKERRGLYGTSGLEGAVRFHDEAFIEISIQDKCRQPQHVISLLDLQNDKRFQNWFKPKSKNYAINFEMFATLCVLRAHWGYSVKECRKIVNQFLEDNKFKIIHDSSNDVRKSFYIRDRECIGNIRGGDRPEEILDILAATPGLWVKACNWGASEESFRIFKAPFLPINHLLKNLNQVSHPLDKDLLKKLKESSSYSNQDFPEAIDAFVRCKKKGDEKSFIKGFRVTENDIKEKKFDSVDKDLIRFKDYLDYKKICQ